MVNKSMKSKYPYFYDYMEQQQERQRIERLMDEAEYRITKFIELKLNEIENTMNQSNINIETTINNHQASNSGVINREIRKMVVEEMKSALK